MVVNVHSVVLPVPPARAGALIDTLGSDHDLLWPGDCWPPMRIEGPMKVGAPGRHGPVTYSVEVYVPSTRVTFRFHQPAGFVGTHTFEVFPHPGGSRLEHRVEITPRGLSRLGWPLLFGPLHDALAEDAVTCAVLATGGTPTPKVWSRWVRLLRALG